MKEFLNYVTDLNQFGQVQVAISQKVSNIFSMKLGERDIILPVNIFASSTHFFVLCHGPFHWLCVIGSNVCILQCVIGMLMYCGIFVYICITFGD